MEQKTEASQAVDLPVLPHLPRAVGYRHTMDNTEGIKGNKPQIYFSSTKPAPFGIPGLDYSASFPVTTEALFTADQMKEYARAALKAQPAPTEVPNFCARCGKRLHAGSIHTCTPPVAEAQPDRHALQAEGTHPAPCARHCEATAFGIEIRRLEAENAQLRAAQGEDSARLELTVEQIVELADKSEFTDPDSGNEQFDRLGFARDVIDADRSIGARASAETGGVKP